MSEEITVTITPDGNVKVSVKGIKGKSCKALTKGLEAAFGDAEHTAQTGEFYEPQQPRIVHQNHS